ncbi:bifunctional 4-hydroxy-2-oxoglutarate aldolase/2-dehydro-3-deoxy-phosphogluconate aldolase [Saccharopolyspora sp. WRP15-2]|uniref:Bifunctional 4-hydroxy-2-oxoglutarate aldolase/2-dehydro-3-deoxy-phosphogluconate aldolase n=1 Tax=Saccharopolyspora oryzae TaxID=2997343 RepID=A0ABT4V4X5_9PSEU|nr:bifunctional 4-hydroxy-2-oxoglutarate aldolase/2-dehydro-3-deoxy-phosphogluconate aldolase [Saccharopolyspora oryzae]MDA3629003.1 bifunctional 4-hydroxy-2-oxoglutarate aldolase/2-dehydro-3-deoxy-phosphogluconate aldolase [Saccharopolyspora oryzae]
MSVLTELGTIRVVPVVEIENADDAVPLARALVAGGLPVMEVTYRTSAARTAIERVAAEVPEMIVGAGTLLSPANVTDAAQAGARFGVAPGCGGGVLAAAREAGLPFVPGAVTPAEIMDCLAEGCDVVKFFPAGSYGGLGTLRSLAGPFSAAGVRFVPTGGVSPDNLADYLAHPAVLAVGGTWIAPRKDITAGKWAEITERARAAVQVVEAAA